MKPIDLFRKIASLYPHANADIREFPSGAVMLDITIGTERYCAEYLPSHQAYGLSKVKGASPFWEGVEESFKTPEMLEARIRELIKMNLTRQP